MGLFGRCGHCNELVEVVLDLDTIIERLDQLGAGQEKIMTALDDDRAAITDLTTEVTAALDALANTVQGGVSEADAEQLAADIRAQSQRIKDALTPAAPVATAPSDGSNTSSAGAIEPQPADGSAPADSGQTPTA